MSIMFAYNSAQFYDITFKIYVFYCSIVILLQSLHVKPLPFNDQIGLTIEVCQLLKENSLVGLTKTMNIVPLLFFTQIFNSNAFIYVK